MTPPTSSDLQPELDRILQIAQDQGLSYIEVLSNDLHRGLGDYPGPNHPFVSIRGLDTT